MRKHSFTLLLLVLTSFTYAQFDPALVSAIKPRLIGPSGTSGRVSAVDAVVKDPKIIYVGTAAGGIWKSIDAGLKWEPIFDDQPVASIGDIKIFQEDPNIIWAGTGEAKVRNSVTIGGGVFKSMDGGKTWKSMGLEKTERINRIALHPRDPNIAYVAALGQLWGENSERGIYRTKDGGKSWAKILYVDEKTGGQEIKVDPDNPHRLYAGMWEFRRWPWFFKSGGKGSGFYMSDDGGDSWKKYEEADGLPTGELGRIAVEIAPSDSNIVYALVEAQQSALLRSDDYGRSFKKVNTSPNIATRPFYYSEIRVDPLDPLKIYNVFANVTRSEDGGKTFETIEAVSCCRANNVFHIDVHAMWINPANPQHFILGSDGGIGITYDRGNSFRVALNLPITQFYHVRVDDQNPYHVYGGLQDNGSFRGIAETKEEGSIDNMHWEEIGFGDGFDAMPDPSNPDAGYSLSQGGNLIYWNLKTGERRDADPYIEKEKGDLRFNWNTGLAQDPFDKNTIYIGSQYLHRSTDKGLSWEIISEDLTSNNPEWQKQFMSGGLTLDATGAENYTTIVAISPSPVQQGVIWVGTDDGRVHITKDAGKSWQRLDQQSSSIPKGAWVPHIEPSPHDASKAFVVFDDHRRSNMKPYVFEVTNYGKSWRSLVTNNLSGYALSIQQDPKDQNLLFLGTAFHLYFSTDKGEHWTKVAGLPTVPVEDLAIQERESDLIIATHGRSAYVIDDYSALRGLTPSDFNNPLKLLSLTSGHQYVGTQSRGTRFTGANYFRGENEPYGVVITFLSSGGEAQKTDKSPKGKDQKENLNKAKLTVLNEEGATIREYMFDVKKGINRHTWDMTDDPMPGFPGAERVSMQSGWQVPPGNYSIRITLGDNQISGNTSVLPDKDMMDDVEGLKGRYKTLQRVKIMQGKMIDVVEELFVLKKRLKYLEDLARSGQTEFALRGVEVPKNNVNAQFLKDAKGYLDKLDGFEKKIRRVGPGRSESRETPFANQLSQSVRYVMSNYSAPSKTALLMIEDTEKQWTKLESAYQEFKKENFAKIKEALDNFEKLFAPKGDI